MGSEKKRSQHVSIELPVVLIRIDDQESSRTNRERVRSTNQRNNFSHQFVLNRVAGGSAARGDPDLAVDRGQVPVDGARSDELFCDMGIGESLGHQAQHLDLSDGQSCRISRAKLMKVLLELLLGIVTAPCAARFFLQPMVNTFHISEKHFFVKVNLMVPTALYSIVRVKGNDHYFTMMSIQNGIKKSAICSVSSETA